MADSSVLPHRLVMQARGLLLAGRGLSNTEIANLCHTTPNTVRRWRTRFTELGLEAVGTVAPGRGRKPLAPEIVESIVRDTLYNRPEDGSASWTTRSMAARHGVGKDTVARVWRDHGLRPWAKRRPSGLSDTSKSGTTGGAAEEEQDAVLGLLAALNEATGEALARCRPREDHRDFLFFLKLIEAIDLWVEHWKDPTRPFTWHSRGDAEARVKRGRAALEHRLPRSTPRSD